MPLFALVELDDESLDEGFVEVVDVAEVTPLILLGLAHEVGFDEIEADLAEIVRLIKAPHGENGSGHHADRATGDAAYAAVECPAAAAAYARALACLAPRLSPAQLPSF